MQNKKEFIRNADYYKRLASEVHKRIGTMDSDLLYEVAYAYKSLEDSEDLKSIREIFESVLDSVDYRSVKKGDSHIGVLKEKYDDLFDASYDQNVMYDSQRRVVSRCLVNNWYIPVLFVLLMLLPKAWKLPLSVSIAVIIAVMGLGLHLLIDLAYITLPAFRMKNYVSNLVSKNTKSLMEEMASEMTEKQIECFDRIDRNYVWLDYMYKRADQIKNETVKNEIVDLAQELAKYKDKQDEWKKEFYLRIVDVEDLFNQFREEELYEEPDDDD